MKKLPSSFRDPSGYVYQQHNQIYRTINHQYREHYDTLMASGLYHSLVKKKLLIPHQENKPRSLPGKEIYKIISPKKIEFISYPYEWCFSQLKDAALLTLKIHNLSLAHGMILKDASAFNIQFQDGQPIFIDTLSFEKYRAGKPWIAYRQFCQHFLAPLALMSYRDARLISLFTTHLDGVPLDLASKLLPLRTWARLPLLMHIHLHAKSQKRYADKTPSGQWKTRSFSLSSHKALLDNLKGGIKKMSWTPTETAWVNYYQKDSYFLLAFKDKKKIIKKWLAETSPRQVWDLGSNTGVFSELASQQNIPTISFDLDPATVEKSYLNIRQSKSKILPLIQDLTNPSPGLGFANKERDSLTRRGPADLLLALALVHHLSISHNIPFKLQAKWFSSLGKFLIIEFVPIDDPKVKKLLSTQTSTFSQYHHTHFEIAFQKHFLLLKRQPIIYSKRVLYLMKRRSL